jgi:hypothetical protein
MNEINNGPFIVGGVGGSGTRVVASILEKLGLFMGHNLNKSKDNLSFTNVSKFLIQNLNLPIKELISQEQPLLKEHDQLLNHHFMLSNKKQWGWKVPGNFFHLHQLIKFYNKNIYYIHIIRNGLDMAYSQNQNQLNNYGRHFNIETNKMPLPLASLRYWIYANQYAINTATELFANKFLLIKYEELCEHPKKIIGLINKFCNTNANTTQIDSLINLVSKPQTIGRYKKKDLSIFTSMDIQSVEDLGYFIEN